MGARGGGYSGFLPRADPGAAMTSVPFSGNENDHFMDVPDLTRPPDREKIISCKDVHLSAHQTAKGCCDEKVDDLCDDHVVAGRRRAPGLFERH